MSTILFAGGGSGGHLFPGVAVAEELQALDEFSRLLFVGSDRALDQQLLTTRGCESLSLSSRASTRFLRSPWRFVTSHWQAYCTAGRILDQTQPTVVVGLGGFASVPVVLAAYRRKIPVVLLEQNAVLGRANRLLLPFSQRICLSFDETPIPIRHRHKARFTGNPVRREIVFERTRQASESRPQTTLLVLGGSQGAVGVNEAVISAMGRLQLVVSSWRIVHQTGPRQCDWVRDEYRRLGLEATVSAFFDDVATHYKNTDLVVSRAGGTTLAELAIHGLPALLIPYPNSVRNHQQRNAEAYVKVGAAEMIEQSADPDQTARVLLEPLLRLLTQTEPRERMCRDMQGQARPEAAVAVMNVILERCPQSQPAAAFSR